MSMIKRFSMSYSIDKASKMKKSKQKWKHDSNDKPALTVDLTTPLIEFGYDIDQIMTAFKLYKFTNIDDAILVMSKDAESGKYNHRFVQSEVNSWTKEKCRICHGVSNDHIDFNLEKEDNTELGKETRINLDFEVSINNTENNLLKDTTGIFKRKIDKSLMKINPSSFSPATINIPQETLDSWEDPDICRICFADKITAEKKLQFSCGHKFCNSCVTNYLKTNINNSVVLFIKCLYGGCARTFTSDEIKNFVDDETYRKYRRFKNFQEKISNPDKIYINCPIVNCEEIVEARHNEEQELITFLECLMGHKFCIKCRKEGWHRGKPCTNVK